MAHTMQNRPVPGQVQWLEDDVRLVLAPNPSAMTFWGTNSYIVGRGAVAVIDPGPDDPAHLAALLGALEPGERVSHILVTHSHLDHSPLAAPLSRATGAPVLGFGDSAAGRSAIMRALLAQSSRIDGGEGVHHGFGPDQTLGDGALVCGESWQIRAHWTPGHFGNHLCFAFGDALFSGDHVMGWASSLVSPPDGDLTQFMASCEALAECTHRVFYPGHGAQVSAPAQRVRDLLKHRQQREAQILEAVARAPDTAAGLAARIYTDVSPALLGAAARNVLAHLIDLSGRALVTPEDTISAQARFHLC